MAHDDKTMILPCWSEVWREAQFTFTSEACRLADMRHCVRSFLEMRAFDECATSSSCSDSMKLAQTSSVTLIITMVNRCGWKWNACATACALPCETTGVRCKPECIRSRTWKISARVEWGSTLFEKSSIT